MRLASKHTYQPSPQTRIFFCMDAFPKTDSERREFIFSRTGFAAKPLGWNDWYWLNLSLNKGFDIGLKENLENGSDRTLQILSLIDQALSQVPRSVGIAMIPAMRADSVAAHCKQSMNIVQSLFQKSGLLDPRFLRQEVTDFRREALLAVWIHDMGEAFFEFTTASDMFHLQQKERDTLKAFKNETEEKVFTFVCQLAVHMIENRTPERFNEIIWNIREATLNAPHKGTLYEQIHSRIATLSHTLDEMTAELGLPTEPSPETKALSELYEKVENPALGNFLHPFVKTVESVEGQRYIQRNSADAPTDRLSRMLDQNGRHPHIIPHELMDDYEIIQGAKRCERRLPMLRERAKTNFERELVKAATSFTYRSVARQFMPGPQDYTGLAPALLDRAAPTPTINIHRMKLENVVALRDEEMAKKQELFDAQQPDDFNARIMQRTRLGHIYRAAEELSAKGRYAPQTDSLIDLPDSKRLDDVLVQNARKRESSGRNQVVRIAEREGHNAR